MRFNSDQLNEVNVLLQFDLSSDQSGIKVHSSADDELIAAAQRLFEKGFIDHSDGGYLTSLGREAAEHAQALFQVFSNPVHVMTGD